MRQTTVQANGLRFGLIETGPDDGRLALCLHGFPDSAWTWRHLLPVLADRGYRAVAPFMRGYSPSEAPAEGSYRVSDLGADACALHELLGSQRPGILIGHDWGAAAVYAALKQEPDRWIGAVTAAVPPTGHIAPDLASFEQMHRSWYGYLLQLPVAEELVAANNFEFIDRLWADWSPGYRADEDLERAKEALRGPGSLLSAIRYYRETPSEIRPPSPSSTLPDVPLLYLHGAQDGCIGLDVLEIARPFFPPRAEVLIVEGAGHFLQLEKAEDVHDRIVGFLDRSV